MFKKNSIHHKEIKAKKYEKRKDLRKLKKEHLAFIKRKLDDDKN